MIGVSRRYFLKSREYLLLQQAPDRAIFSRKMGNGDKIVEKQRMEERNDENNDDQHTEERCGDGVHFR